MISNAENRGGLVPGGNRDRLGPALESLYHALPRLVSLLKLENIPDMAAFSAAMESRLLPRFHPDLPLLAAVCGGGSSGKSTLFNAIAGAKVSPVGGRAGINRRLLLGAHPDFLQNERLLADLFRPLGSVPKAMEHPDQLTIDGDPLFSPLSGIPPTLAVMDTPDFDTGAAGVYTNRDAAEQALAAADLLIYIFTNSNYNNRDNTDFIARMLTSVGMRKCILIYRCYPSFSEADILEHAGVVAANLYGGELAEQYVMGVYRMDEDNLVAAGEKPPVIRPARKDLPGLTEALQAFDVGSLRVDLHASMLADIADRAEDVLKNAYLSQKALTLYSDAIKAARSLSVREALQHFPMDQVLRHFTGIWQNADPGHIKFMRKTGSVVEWPLKIVTGIVRRSASGASPKEGGAEGDYEEKLREDLVSAANQLHASVVDEKISVTLPAADPSCRNMQSACAVLGTAEKGEGPLCSNENGKTNTIAFTVPAHPALSGFQTEIRKKDWKGSLHAILSREDAIIAPSEHMDSELRKLADELRMQMTLWDKVRQSFSAFLNVLPATAAVTYILSTGDPAGAVGIKVKLTGLFGLKDLYALVAIPATSGLKRADRHQLERLLAPIARTWLDDKLALMETIFDDELTGRLIREAESTIVDSQALVKTVEDALSVCRAGKGGS